MSMVCCGFSKYEPVIGAAAAARDLSPLSRVDASQQASDIVALEQLVIPFQSNTSTTLVPCQQVPVRLCFNED